MIQFNPKNPLTFALYLLLVLQMRLTDWLNKRAYMRQLMKAAKIRNNLRQAEIKARRIYTETP